MSISRHEHIQQKEVKQRYANTQRHIKTTKPKSGFCRGDCHANTPKGPTDIEVIYSERWRDTGKIREKQQEKVKNNNRHIKKERGVSQRQREKHYKCAPSTRNKRKWTGKRP